MACGLPKIPDQRTHTFVIILSQYRYVTKRGVFLPQGKAKARLANRMNLNDGVNWAILSRMYQTITKVTNGYRCALITEIASIFDRRRRTLCSVAVIENQGPNRVHGKAVLWSKKRLKCK